MKNQLTKLYNAVSAHIAATPAERLQSVRDTASFLYNRMMENMGYGQETLKDTVEKEAEEQQQEEEETKKQRQGSAEIQEQQRDDDERYDTAMGALRGNSFYGRMIEGLDRPPTSAQGWIKEIQKILKIFVQINPLSFTYVPDFLKTQEMCNRAVDEWPWLLKYVPDQYKTKELCYKTVGRYLSSLQFVPDWFVTQQQLKI